MIVNHTRSLHVGITNSSAEKLEAAFSHILANCIGYRRACRGKPRMIVDGFTIGHKAVQVLIKRPKFLLHLNKQLCIIDGCQYL